MALATGMRLGVYEILGVLGAGGMGEVYRARDSKLGREVAIKILPESFATDPERIARFEREAKTLAALNHTNIGHIYGLEESGGTRGLVLELVEGPTLADRISHGPVPSDEALAIAKQIAEALAAAHEQGIIHRDLKPANIKVRSDGMVKVLDFGLAKALGGGGSGGTTTPLANSPTITSPVIGMTGIGVILGTAAYMAPEQAKGFEADQRSDIFAFGCILFEMLTGRQAFDGDTVPEILAAVLKTEVDYSLLPPRLTPRLVEVLRRCLEKNRKNRWHAAADVRIEIESIGGALVTDELDRRGIFERPRWKRIAAPLAFAIGGGLLAGYGVWTVKREPVPAVTRFAITLPEDQQFTNTGRNVVAQSPDGTQLAYIANQRLYVRSMSSLESRAIVDDDVGSGVFNPVFSPDGQALAFFSGGSLKRLSIAGGVPVQICSVDGAGPVGLSWDEHGIVFGQPGKGVMRVSPEGGMPEVLVAVANDELAVSPQMLPGGRSVLFTLRKTSQTYDQGQIVVQPLNGGARKVLVNAGGDGRYVPTGHLVYPLSRTLFAVRLDLEKLAVIGDPVPIVEGIRRTGTGSGTLGTAILSFSTTGTLAYVPSVNTGSGAESGLGIFNRQGDVEPLKLPPGQYSSPRASPNGKFITFERADERAGERQISIWVYELAGGRAPQQLTFGGNNSAPVWSPDGTSIAFQSDREGDLAIWQQRADGSGRAERLTRPDLHVIHTPQSWARNGAHLLFSVEQSSESTLWTRRMKDGQIERFGEVLAREAAFSPDGQWVAYQAPERPVGAVWLAPFPWTGSNYRVTASGGHPYWSPAGDEIFVNLGLGGSRVINVVTTPRVSVSRPAYFPQGERSEPSTQRRRGVDIMPDGQHFVGVPNPGAASGRQTAQIAVVLNWFEELRRLVPTR